MQARIGDHIVIQGHRVGESIQDGEVIEVRGKNGQPPYIVRWTNTGHETLVFPGPDAVVRPPQQSE